MIQDWFSRYTFKYPRALAYMLQVTEYHISQYLIWHGKTKNFGRVEYRGHLVKTWKAHFILAVLLLSQFVLYASAIMIIFREQSLFGYALAVLIFLVTPFILAYWVLIPLSLLTVFIQWPVEYVIFQNTRIRLGAHKGYKIAIAGSFGKTTAREIFKTVLGEGKKVSAPQGSYNTPLGIAKFVKELKGDEEILVFEFGEHYPGDIKKLCRLVRPDMGIITGVNEAHLERFGTLDRTIATIFELADYLGEKPVYVNGENENSRKNARPHHIVYSNKGVGTWKAEELRTSLTGTYFTLFNGTKKFEFHSSLLGLHHVGILATAIHIAERLGLPPEQIVGGVEKTKPFEHRLEPNRDNMGVTTLDDSYNGNPDGVKAVIAFLASLEGHRRFYVTPGLVEMGSKAKEIHKEIGRQLAKAGIEKIVLIKNSVTPYIKEGLEEAGSKAEVMWFDDGPTAYKSIPSMTVSEDVVLLQNDWPDQYK